MVFLMAMMMLQNNELYTTQDLLGLMNLVVHLSTDIARMLGQMENMILLRSSKHSLRLSLETKSTFS